VGVLEVPAVSSLERIHRLRTENYDFNVRVVPMQAFRLEPTGHGRASGGELMSRENSTLSTIEHQQKVDHD
jgi:hypothetical protein